MQLFEGCPSQPNEQRTFIVDPFLAVVRNDKRLRYDRDIENELGSNGVIALWNSRTMQAISTGIVSYDFLKVCLKTYKEQHPCYARPKSVQRGLRYIKMIDCDSTSITQMPLDAKYLALSYVWGDRTGAESQTLAVRDIAPAHLQQSRIAVDKDNRNWPFGADDGSISIPQLPLTIRDALQVVRELGMKYLCVDCLCIDQHDPEEKAVMLQNMDQVYSLADATIVALHGRDSSAGLPGVSSVVREEQSSFDTPRGVLLSTLKPLEAAVEESVWATRGWTYQEVRLSRRCFFFTSSQVYFSCQQHTRSETVPGDARSSNIAVYVNRSALEPGLFGYRRSMAGALSLDKLLYTSRQLTFPLDSLDAFQGILRKSGFVTFYGIPIVPLNAKLDPNLGFSMGLLWRRKPLWMRDRLYHSTTRDMIIYSRRPCFPTWSWASVSGPAWHDSHGPSTQFSSFLEGSQAVSLDVRPPVKYSLQPAAGRFEPIEHIMRTNRSPLIPEIHSGIFIEHREN